MTTADAVHVCEFFGIVLEVLALACVLVEIIGNYILNSPKD